MDSYNKLRNQMANTIKNNPVPTAKENIAMFKKLYALRSDLPNRKEEYDTLRQKIIISNGGFAMKYAIIYCKKINDSKVIDDLFQQAQIGIIEAVDKFDPFMNINFTTYAYYYVKKCIIDFIKRNKVVSVNRNIARYISHICDARDKLFTVFEGFEPSVEDINKFLKDQKNIEIKDQNIIINLLNLIDLNSTSDQSFTTNNIDSLSYSDEHETLLLFHKIIYTELKDLSKENLDIVQMRFGMNYDRPYSLEEIKLLKGLSDEEINKIRKTCREYI